MAANVDVEADVDELGDEIHSILTLGPEKDGGDTEYKRSLLGKDKDRQLKLETQMRYRMEEGNGQCTYIIGVDDDGTSYGLTEDEYEETRAVLDKIAKRNDYSLRLLTSSKCKRRRGRDKTYTQGSVYEFLVRENNLINYEEIKIATGGNVDSAKCECRDTKIRMYSGDVKNIQDIVKGDLLMGDDGKSRKILTTTKGWGQMYKIIPVNGTSLIVNKNHVLCFKASNYNISFWDKARQRYSVRTFALKDGKPKLVTKTFLVRPDNGYYLSKTDAETAANDYLLQVLSDSQTIKLGDVVELTLNDFINLTKLEQSALKLFRVGIEFKEQSIELDPYMLGYWLGDGNSSDSIIYTAEKEVVKYYEKNLSLYDLEIHYRGDYKYRIKSIHKQRKRNNHFRNCLKKYNLYKNKHIPTCYKYNTRDIRLRLLAGLIDSDGTLKNGGYVIAMAQKNKKLVDDIVELSRSLGFASYPRDEQVICTNGKNGPVECYAIRFSINGEGIEQIPVIVPRKKTSPRKSPKNVLVTGIKEIKILPDQEYFGFELDGNGRYLHDDYTVTHNSTTIGVLISGQLDNGNGSARNKVLTFKHEVESGRTSSISQQLLGYDPEGKVVNHDDTIKKISWPEIAARSSKVIKFFDLCGHAKYSKTTIRGFISNSIDYAIITVGANMGSGQFSKEEENEEEKEGKKVGGSTEEHIQICLTLRIPIIILLTKIDLGEKVPDVMKETLDRIKKIFSKPGWRKMLFHINNMSDVITVAKSMKGGDIVPIFKTSNVRGDGISLVHEFLNMLRPRLKFDENAPVEMHIGETFMPVGIGLVIGGFLKKGTIKIGQEYLLGPMNDGSSEYKKIKCRSLHVNRTYVQQATPGRYVCFNVPKVERKQVSKGMVIVSTKEQCVSVQSFTAEIIVHKSRINTTIRVGYEIMVHVNAVRAVAKLLEIKEKKSVKLKKSSETVNVGDASGDAKDDDTTSLRQGDRAIIKLKFKQKPRYLKVGNRILLAETKVKMVGRVMEIDVT
uniref:DOD-type homing endonuclease domain-containing protein n=1 Tax=Marseillevirus LCMAC101 TaxID=2506602 RepID=A0A481YU92_9VIRU|nr:MAG: uncharacterized protein LCMAC101_06990 [Marseillevirus LCMAC101]